MAKRSANLISSASGRDWATSATSRNSVGNTVDVVKDPRRKVSSRTGSPLSPLHIKGSAEDVSVHAIQVVVVSPHRATSGPPPPAPSTLGARVSTAGRWNPHDPISPVAVRGNLGCETYSRLGTPWIEGHSPSSRRAVLADMSERLAQDHNEESEYVRGVGLVRRRLLPPEPSVPSIKREVPKQQRFPLVTVSFEHQGSTGKELHWNGKEGYFDVVVPEQTLRINADAVLAVFYDLSTGMFLLQPDPEALPARQFTQVIFEVGGEKVNTAWQLRNLLESCLGGMKVHKKESEYFVGKQHQYIQSQVNPSICVPGHVGTATPKSSAARGATVISESTRRRLEQIARNAMLINEPLPPATSQSSSYSAPAEADLARAAMELFYRSGEPVEVNDLVVRVRDPKTIEFERNKLNTEDVYDGPFRVVELPRQKGTAKELFSDDEEMTQTEEDVREAMFSKLVRLKMPEGTKADEWVEIERLRLVYSVQRDFDEDISVRDLFYAAKHEKTKETEADRGVNQNDAGGEEEGALIYVFRLQKGRYFTCSFTGNDSTLGDDMYEVEKLRGKRIDRAPRAQFPDEAMDDPEIKAWLEAGNVLRKGEVLVVKYLVHWAGYPSEDDSWERAQDNLPDEFLQKYEALHRGKLAGIPIASVSASPSPVKKKKRRMSGTVDGA